MATSHTSQLPSLSCLNRSLCSCRHKAVLINYSQVRCHGSPDQGQGKEASIVDKNLKVLKERIEEVRKKEELKLQRRTAGWSYQSIEYDHSSKEGRNAALCETIELVSVVTGAFLSVFLVGSFCIFFVSLVFSFNY
ncbi:hypothetical protein Ancab_018458 [Ancistrocladus abbreviatus]